MNNVVNYLKLHAPPVTLIVGILAWIFGKRVSGPELQEIGQILTLVIGGAHLPAAGHATARAASAIKTKVSGPKKT